jgi:hypothetical protein
LTLAAVAILLRGALLLFLEGGMELVPGRCPTGFSAPSAEGVGGETKELLGNANFEATPAAARDLRAGAVGSRLVDPLGAVAEEHRVCVVAFKEGRHYLPVIAEGPLIPEGYGEAGVMFSEYTRPGSELPHRAERGEPQARSVIDLEARLLGYLSRAVSVVQVGQTVERFR